MSGKCRLAVEWLHLGRYPPRIRTGRADRGVDGADVALNRIGHGREFREHQPRDRHPSCSPTVARRPADARDRQQPVSGRWPSPPTGGSTIRLGDVATAVAVPGVAFRAARITRGCATSPREAHWLDFLTRRYLPCDEAAIAAGSTRLKLAFAIGFATSSMPCSKASSTLRPRYGRRGLNGSSGSGESAGASGHRHGHRSRSLMGSFGRVEIAVPRARLNTPDGKTTEWKSKALRAYQRRTLAADALIASTYLAGTNTRRVRRALAALFGGAVGKDTVSRVWRKVKSDWDAWNARSLAEEPIVRL